MNKEARVVYIGDRQLAPDENQSAQDAEVVLKRGNPEPVARTSILTPDTARVAAKNARSVLAPAGRPYKELGSLEGYFETVDTDRRGRGRPVLYMKSRVTGDEIKCFVTGEAKAEISHVEVGDVWSGRRMSVFGTIHYSGPGRISHMEAIRIRFLRSRNDLPDIDDIIDPDFTGGLKSEDYLERLRNGDLSLEWQPIPETKEGAS